MKLTRSSQPNWTLFALVPFINVLFLVVIFFGLSTRFVVQPGVAVSLPFSPFRLAPERNPEVVSITSAPVPAMYFRDERVTLDQLAETLSRDRASDRTLIIKADRNTPYENVVGVMNAALKLGIPVVLAGGETAR